MKKLKNKKLIIIIVALVVVSASAIGVFCILNGGNFNGKHTEETTTLRKITTESEAINAVKNYGNAYYGDRNLGNKIAGALGFKTYYSPNFATSSATKNSDGSWNVNIKGKMSGHIDEYGSDLQIYKFEITATVSEIGEVRISVNRVF